MAGRKNKKKDLVQIDADWLLGEFIDPPTMQRGWFGRTILLLVCVTTIVWTWPFISKQWLQWEWQTQLAQSESKTSDDVLPILLALNDLNPKQNQSIVQQLASTDPERRLIAFHLLQQRIERWSSSNRPTLIELAAFSDSLQSMPSNVAESILLRGQLAARMLTFVGPEIPDSSQLRGNIEAMIARASTVSTESAPSNSNASFLNSIADNGKDDGSKESSTQRRIFDSTVRPILGDRGFQLPDPPSLNQRSSEPRFASRFPTDSVSPTSVSPTLSSAIPKIASMNPSILGGLPTIKASESIAPERLVPTHNLTWVENTPVSTTGTDPEQPYTPIRGIEKLPIEKLLPLLSSAQPRIVRDATKELGRRGMNDRQIAMALDLAQGDLERRLEAIQELVRDPNLDRVPWLVWMAERGDSRVRRRAIATLGSLSSSDAANELRMLKSRELDSSIVDEISQVLMAINRGK